MEINQITQIMKEIEERAINEVYECAPGRYILKADEQSYNTAFKISDIVNANYGILMQIKSLSDKLDLECMPIPAYGEIIAEIEDRGIRNITVVNGKPIMQSDLPRYEALSSLKNFIEENQNIIVQLNNLARKAGIETNSIVAEFDNKAIAQSDKGAVKPLEETQGVEFPEEFKNLAEAPAEEPQREEAPAEVPPVEEPQRGEVPEGPTSDIQVPVIGVEQGAEEEQRFAIPPEERAGSLLKPGAVPAPAALEVEEDAALDLGALSERLKKSSTSDKTARVMNLLSKYTPKDGEELAEEDPEVNRGEGLEPAPGIVPPADGEVNDFAHLEGDTLGQNGALDNAGTEPAPEDEEFSRYVPQVEPPQYNDYKAMTADEIKASQEMLGIEPNPEVVSEAPVAPEQSLAIPTPPVQKVTGRRMHSWLDSASKLVTMFKGLYLAEDVSQRTPEYRDLNKRIQNLGVHYAEMTAEEAQSVYNEIDREIATNDGLEIGEKKKLFKRLSPVSKKIRRYHNLDGNSRGR